jgi:hypothetical protein
VFDTEFDVKAAKLAAKAAMQLKNQVSNEFDQRK